MELGQIAGPVVVAAIVSGIISIVSIVVNRSTIITVHEARMRGDHDLAERKFGFDKELAERKFADEKAQLIHKRQFELAETILADAYRFREIMGDVRNGAALGSEGQSRERDANETEPVTNKKDTYFVPLSASKKKMNL